MKFGKSVSEKCVYRQFARQTAVGSREKQWQGRAMIDYYDAQPLNVEMSSIAISKAEGSFARIRA